MTAPGIAVVSTATVITAEEVKTAVAGCAAQLVEDFCPAWSKLPIVATFYNDPADVPAGTPTIVIADVCDDPQALAYHTEQTDGAITGLVGAKTCIDAGESWSSALSHELLETARDPFCDEWVAIRGGRRLIAAEVCDPVQDRSYEKNGVLVSSFVLPAWFDETPPKGSKFDWQAVLRDPFSRTHGGYFVQKSAGGETTSEGMRAKHRPKLGRGARRMGVDIEAKEPAA